MAVVARWKNSLFSDPLCGEAPFHPVLRPTVPALDAICLCLNPQLSIIEADCQNTLCPGLNGVPAAWDFTLAGVTTDCASFPSHCPDHNRAWRLVHGESIGCAGDLTGCCWAAEETTEFVCLSGGGQGRFTFTASPFVHSGDDWYTVHSTRSGSSGGCSNGTIRYGIRVSEFDCQGVNVLELITANNCCDWPATATLVAVH